MEKVGVMAAYSDPLCVCVCVVQCTGRHIVPSYTVIVCDPKNVGDF